MERRAVVRTRRALAQGAFVLATAMGLVGPNDGGGPGMATPAWAECPDPPAATVDRIYVDDDAEGGADNGSSWAHAYRDLQEALDAAACMTMAPEIWVARGTYTPRLAFEGAERTESFTLPDGVRLYGGFRGDHETSGLPNGETCVEQRQPARFPAILSGDLAAAMLEALG